MPIGAKLFAIACAAAATDAAAVELSTIGPDASAEALLAARPALSESALELVYDVKGGDAAGAITITVARDFSIVAKGRTSTVYDYALRRIIMIDDGARSFQNSSLYALVDFLVAETYNRRLQRNLLSSAGLKRGADFMDPVWVQAELHVMDPEDGTPALDRSADPDGTINYLYKGSEVASYAPSKLPLAADDVERFKKALRVATTLHPTIIDEIGAGGFVPQRISFATPPMRKKPATQWTLRSALATTAAFPLRPGDKATMPALPAQVADLWPIMLAAKSGQGPGRRTPDEYRRAIEEALPGNPFKAAVLVFEDTLEFGTAAADCPDPGKCHALKEVFAAAEADPRMAVLVRALGTPKNKEEGRAWAKELQTMKRDDLADAFVIDDFRANLLVGSGDPGEAVPLFAASIKGNPRLGGYYKDVGDAFRYSFEPETAWVFYDMGRELPDGAAAPVISEMNNYEAELAKRHPEFF
jgi:hypothetical protein